MLLGCGPQWAFSWFSLTRWKKTVLEGGGRRQDEERPRRRSGPPRGSRDTGPGAGRGGGDGHSPPFLSQCLSPNLVLPKEAASGGIKLPPQGLTVGFEPRSFLQHH